MKNPEQNIPEPNPNWFKLPDEEKKAYYNARLGKNKKLDEKSVLDSNTDLSPNDTVVDITETQKLVKSEKDAVSDFLNGYSSAKGRRISIEQKKILQESIDFIDAKDLSKQKKLIAQIISSRTEQLQNKQKRVFKIAEADTRIRDYISNIVEIKDISSQEADIFKGYLFGLKQKANETGNFEFQQESESLLQKIDKKNKESKNFLEATLVPEIEKRESEFQKTEERKEEKQPQLKEKEITPKDKIEALYIAKQGIELKISQAEDSKTKEKLLKEKKELMEMIIDYAEQLPEFKNIKREINLEKEKEWEKGIALSGYKNLDNYKKWHENIYCDEFIKNSSLSKKQKEDIAKNGSIIVSNWPKTIELNKNDIVIAMKMGINIKQIKSLNWWNPFSKKIKAGQKIFDDIDKFNEYLAENKIKEIDSDVEQRITARKNEIIAKNSDIIVANKIDKIIESLQKNDSKSEKLAPIEEKLTMLNKIGDSWNKANEIYRALKDKNWKIKTESEELLIGNNAKEKMESMMTELSESVIKTASILSGRNLKKEAEDITGYKLDKNLEKQKEWRQWLTNEVKNIFDIVSRDIEKETGKKITVKLNKKKLSDINARNFKQGIKKGSKIKPLIYREIVEE